MISRLYLTTFQRIICVLCYNKAAGINASVVTCHIMLSVLTVRLDEINSNVLIWYVYKIEFAYSRLQQTDYNRDNRDNLHIIICTYGYLFIFFKVYYINDKLMNKMLLSLTYSNKPLKMLPKVLTRNAVLIYSPPLQHAT